MLEIMIIQENQIANRTGIYRCVHDGQTQHAVFGQELEPCSCGKAPWLYFPSDNLLESELTPIYLNNIQAIEVPAVPSLSSGINLVSTCGGASIVTGHHVHSGLMGEKPAITVESVGPYDPELLAYFVRMLAC
jgi:hypothetical protein